MKKFGRASVVRPLCCFGSTAQAHETDRLTYLRCEGTDDRYEWHVDYRLAINLDMREVTTRRGKVLKPKVFNDGVIVVRDEYRAHAELGLPGVDTLVSLNIERSGLGCRAYQEKGHYEQEPIYLDGDEQFRLLPYARGLCIIQSGF